MLDYETLRVIWWLILGVLLVGFAATDGFDLGVCAIFRWVGRTEEERRALLESVEPVWEGNQVWFILGGGAVFAAWPLLYAASFSSLYLAMFLVLLGLILRPVGFGFRGKLTAPAWRNACDWALLAGGAVPALLFGVAFGNLLLRIPFHFDAMMRPVYTGGFFNLLHPFALLCGLVSLAMLVMHGATYASFKVAGDLGRGRPRSAGLRRGRTSFFLSSREFGCMASTACKSPPSPPTAGLPIRCSRWSPYPREHGLIITIITLCCGWCRRPAC